MKFVNVNDETYDRLKEISEHTGQSMPEVVDTIIKGFVHFSMLSQLQGFALDLADSIINEEKD